MRRGNWQALKIEVLTRSVISLQVDCRGGSESRNHGEPRAVRRRRKRGGGAHHPSHPSASERLNLGKKSLSLQKIAYMSKTSLLIHIVFATKYRQGTITNEHRRDLYAYIWGIIKAKNCFLYKLSGVPNHVHMLVDIHPTVSLSDLVKAIKSSSSIWLRNNPKFPRFEGWGHEYFAASVSFDDRDAVIQYIDGQQAHHGITEFASEMELLCANHGMYMHPDDFK